MASGQPGSPEELETAVRSFLVKALPDEETPAYLRLAFHDAGNYDVKTKTGGARGAIRLREEYSRPENAVWCEACLEVLTQAKERFPQVSWADLIAVGGAAAVEKSGGPVIPVGLGRTDASEPSPEDRLPTGTENATQLRNWFAAIGLSHQDLVALSGAHTLGDAKGRAFTPDPLTFSNSYFTALLTTADGADNGLLPSDRALVTDPELRSYVELYARDAGKFFADFAEAYRRLTWLGNDLAPEPTITR